jgi:hypothetical protein
MRSSGARPPIKRHTGPKGKRVVFVTPYAVAAKEEGEKQSKKGFRVEVKKERNDMGEIVYVVYVFDLGF